MKKEEFLPLDFHFLAWFFIVVRNAIKPAILPIAKKYSIIVPQLALSN